MSQRFESIACTVCGCVCDDLTLTTEDNRIIAVERACKLAEPWFLSQNERYPPMAHIEGTPVAYSDAIDRAVELLTRAKAPLIYGLSRSTTEGQRAAVALAEKLGAVIDTTASTGHAPSLLALQQVGESTCTLGEVKNRADLVIYWTSDPQTTHPRHAERYAVEPVGRSIPNGRVDRHVVVVDRQRSATYEIADTFIPIEEGHDWDALRTLHGLVNGIAPRAGFECGADLAALTQLAERMKNCRFGIVFFGSGLASGPTGHRTVEALLQLTTALNAHTRFYARRMRRLGDVAGADSVLTWQTGYPFAVDFARGYPRYNPGEFSAPELLARGEVDLCLCVGSETTADFSSSARAHLEHIPTITLETPTTVPPFRPTVMFTTAVYGVHRPGTAYRMDEVPIPLRMVLETNYPSDGEVLAELLQQSGSADRADR